MSLGSCCRRGNTLWPALSLHPPPTLAADEAGRAGQLVTVLAGGLAARLEPVRVRETGVGQHVAVVEGLEGRAGALDTGAGALLPGSRVEAGAGGFAAQQVASVAR